MVICRARTASRRHKTFPVFRSRASVISLSPSVAVRKMRSAVMTGDERAKGTGVFQATFFVELNSAGRGKPSATPVPFGPRNCSHSSVRPSCPYKVDSVTTKNEIAINRRERERFMFLMVVRGDRTHVLSGQGSSGYWLILAQSLEVRNTLCGSLRISALSAF